MGSELSAKHFQSSNMFTNMGYLSVTGKSVLDVEDSISDIQSFMERKYNTMMQDSPERDIHLTFHSNETYFPDDVNAVCQSNFDDDAVYTVAIKEIINNEAVNVVASSVYIEELVDAIIAKQRYTH